MTDKPRMSAEDVAERLHVATSTVRSYASRGQMPKPTPCSCCGHISWNRVELETWIAGRRWASS